MVKDSRLEKLRVMDPIIGTFTAQEVVNDPDFVNQTYLEHAETHMSLGDTSSYVSTLLRWVQVNKGVVIGAITGEVGYGKTSMAIYLWQQCEKARVVAVPPFEWHRLQDIIDATWAWVRYRVGKIQPSAVKQIDLCYEKYREKSVQEFAETEGMSISKVQDLLDRRMVNLQTHSKDVIDFLREISSLLESEDLRLQGPVVFTDELQVTMSRYLVEHHSRDEFMQDVFEMLNPLLNMEGSFGLILGMVNNTETLIATVRPDILQRLQHCNLLIRPSTMYQRDFPQELWRRFAQVFEFGDIAAEILPLDTLDSIGQVTFRDDLGAGPRAAIQAMQIAIEHYDQTGQPFTPIDLIDNYLAGQVSYEAGGKLVKAIMEVLQSQELRSIPDGERTIKLMAAFPMGCSEDRFKVYELQDTRDEVSKRLYTEYLYKFPEGISLRKLARSDRPTEPRFIELTKNFIQTYSESERDLDAALRAFRDIVLPEELLISRRKDQIEGWITDPNIVGQYIGAFDARDPERRLVVRVSRNRTDLLEPVAEFGLSFLFSPECTCDTPGKIERAGEAGNMAIFCLNLLRQPDRALNIPYIEELGYPVRKITPAFMLALLWYLHSNDIIIPEDEKRLQIPTLKRSLIGYTIQLLFDEALLANADFTGLSKVGLTLLQEVFTVMCRERYPDYTTLITTGRWERNYTTYLGALGSQIVSSSVSVLRGNKPLELPQRDVLSLFGETKVQTFKGLAENLLHVLEVDLGTKTDALSTVRFKLHPAEQAFMDILHRSDEKFISGSVELHALEQHSGFAVLRKLGYRDEEISIIFQLLKARRLVDFNEKRRRFEEVLVSPIERRDAILTALSDLEQRAETLARIPELDRERFSASIARLVKQVTVCQDVESLEEHQSELSQLQDELAQFSKKWANRIQGDFERIHHATGEVLRASLPADLSRSLKSDVSWVGELMQCQALLKDKYQRNTALFRNIENRTTTAWNAWTTIASRDPAALVALYETSLATQSELRDAQADLEAAKGYLKSYVAWSNVLNTASRAYQEATGCAISYKEECFKQELDGIFADITTRFQKKRLEALPDHEMYADQVKEIQTQIDTWLRDRRENFMQDKRFYEDTLQSFGVERFNLHATFDAFDPETSRVNLFSEVLEKTLQYVQIKEQELERYRSEALYAGQVVGVDVAAQSELISESLLALTQTKGRVQSECVRKQACFASLGEKLGALNVACQDIARNSQGIMQKRPPAPDEEVILNTLQDPRGTDLSVVIAGRLAQEGDAFSLDALMQMVTALFKKNQVIIRLEKRR